MNHPEPSPHPEHVIQLFDAARSRAEAAARFIAEGWETGDRVVVIAKPAHWELIADDLERRGCPARSAAPARFQYIDAHAVLRRMRKRGIFVRHAARDLVEEMVKEAVAPGRPLRVYGEAVDILAEEGSFNEACDLEQAWNTALRGHAARLFCAYTAAHFADPRQAGWLKSICAHHAHIDTHPADTLGTWLASGLTPART